MSHTALRASVTLAVTSLVAFVLPTTSFAADSTTGGISAPAQSDNQLNNTGSNSQKTSNDAGTAANNGGTIGNAVNSATDATKNTSDQLKNTADAAGAGTPTADNPAPDAKGIRKTLGGVATEAMEKGDLDDLVSLFSATNRDRIKKSDTYEQSYGEKLDGRIDTLQQAWKNKYGHDFSLKHANKLLGDDFAKIQQAQVGNNTDVETVVKAIGGETDLQAGRAIAIAVIVASHGMPELKVPLVHELPDSWKIDVPADVDATKLRQNLTDHLTALGEHTADWPSEETDAYRAVTHHVLMAVLNKPVAWQGDTNASADMSK